MNSSRTLGVPLRAAVVLKYWGQLSLLAGALALVPLLVSLRLGETQIALRHALAVALLCGPGWVASRLRGPRHVHPNEAMAIAALAFITTPLPLTLPLMGAGIGFVDALFEAVSGVTTTGLSTMQTVAGMPDGFHFQRAYMQWFGGLGIVVLLLALTPRPGRFERGLSLAERVEDDLVGGTAAHARRALITYGTVTALAMAALWLSGADGYRAVLYGLSSVSTGGFAPDDRSLGGLPGYAAQVVTTLVCVAGATSLVTLRGAVREGPARVFRDPQFLALLIVGLGASVACALSLHLLDGMPWADAAAHAPMMAFSAQTTSGFSSLAPAQIGNGTMLVLMASMILGGSLGSSAGGIKLLRALILLRVFRAYFVRLQLSRHAVYEPRVGGHVIAREEVQSAALVSGIFLAVVVLSWGAFVIYGAQPLPALFEVVSATGTVGLTSGLSASGLPTALKLVLCADMWMGRLEIIPVLILLRAPHPRAWIRSQR